MFPPVAEVHCEEFAATTSQKQGRLHYGGFSSWFLDDKLQITKFILGIVKDRLLNSSHGSKYLLQLWMSRARTE